MRLPKAKRIVAGLSVAVLLSTNIINTVFGAGQMQYVGTRAAIGSPLISTNFTEDNWDSWEMLCFGVFLSNFCEPFQDDYSSAFTEGASDGSQGKGLEALQFSTGGDSQADAYLRDMLDYCINMQAKSMRRINVQYKVYEYGQEQTDGSLADLGSRQAYLDDLIPVIFKYDDSGTMSVGGSSAVEYPMVFYSDVDISTGVKYTTQTRGLRTEGTLAIARYAVLPEFFVGSNPNTVSSADITTADSSTSSGGTAQENGNTVFELANGWDLQVLMGVLSQAFDPVSDVKVIEEATAISPGYYLNFYKSLFTTGNAFQYVDDILAASDLAQYLSSGSYPLYMDSFGNICIQRNGRYVIVIPASANGHITKTETHNLVNSIIVNNFVLNTSEANVVAYANSSGFSSANTMGGNPFGAESVEASGVQSGKFLLTTSTMPRLTNSVYQKLREQGATDRTVDIQDDMTGLSSIALRYPDPPDDVQLDAGTSSDFSAGKSILELISDDPLDSDFQWVITGVDARLWSKLGIAGTPFGIDRDNEVRTMSSTLAALQLLGNSFPVSSSVDRLDYVIQYDAGTTTEEVAQPLFDANSSYYLLPSSQAWSAKRLYTNYYLGLLNGTESFNSSEYSFDAEQARNKMSTYDSPLDVELNTLLDVDTTTFLNSFAGTSVHLTETTATLGGSGDLKLSTTLNPFFERYYTLNGDINSARTVSDYKTIVKEPKSGYTFLTDDWYSTLGGVVNFFTDWFTNDKWEMSTPLTVANNMSYAWVVRALKPAEYFTIASQVFGVDEGVQFELYTPQIYLSYLTFYGLMDSDESTNNFNQNLFQGADFLSFTADNFELAKSPEQQEAEIRLNVYRLLSLDNSGERYRETWFNSILKSLFVTPFSESLDSGDSLIGEKTKFLDVSTVWENPLTSLIMDNWSRISQTIFMTLFIVAVLSGLLNRRKLTWYLALALTLAGTIYIVPTYLDITPTMCNQFINAVYGAGSSYWAVAESIRTDQQEESLGSTLSDDSRIQALLSGLNFLDQDNTLMIKLDISRKIIQPMSGVEGGYEAVQSKSTLRWLLPSIMKQISATDGSYDYVSIPMSQMYSNFANTYNTYATTQYLSTVYKSNASFVDTKDLPTADQKLDRFGAYKSSYDPMVLDASDTYRSVTRLNPDESNIHTGFYLLEGLSVKSPYEATYTGANSSLSMQEWFNIQKNVESDWNVAGGGGNSLLTYWNNTLQDAMVNYDRYNQAQPQQAGYLYITEGLGTYFYTLAKDTFKEYESGKTLANVMLNLQGGIETSPEGEEVRTSFMHQGTTGELRDFLDMEEVFTNVMPYLYQLQTLACGDSETSGLLGDLKITASEYYDDNYASWAFRSNWVTKIYEDSLYGSSRTVRYTDASGAEKTAEIENICDPRAYPDDRPMVFSEAQQAAQGLRDSQLTVVELKLVQLGRDVEERWTSLLNYTSLDGMTVETVYRMMAMEAWIVFNNTFTSDNFFVSAKTLYPTSYDLRSLSFITLFRSMISDITSNTTYMSVDVPEKLYEDYGLFVTMIVRFMVFGMTVIFPTAREWFLMLELVLCLITVILNITSPAGNRIRAAFGWLLTATFFTGITILYYLIVGMFMSNPTADTVINAQTALGEFGKGFGLAGISLLISILSIAYAVGAMYFCYCLITSKHGLSLKDGGFGFYYTLANKAFGALGNKISKGFNKVGGALGVGSAPKKEKAKDVIVKNKEKEAANVRANGGKLGVQDTKQLYNDNRSGTSERLNIGANDAGGTVPKVANSQTTKEINAEIEKGIHMGGTESYGNSNTARDTTDAPVRTESQNRK